MRRLVPSRPDLRGGERLQFQIVIGNEVQQVYRLLYNVLLEKKGAAGSDKNAKPAGIVALIISVISRSFTPAITGTGMIKALLHIKRSVFMDGSLSGISELWQE